MTSHERAHQLVRSRTETPFFMQYNRNDSDSSSDSPPNLSYPAHQQQPPLQHPTLQDFAPSRYPQQHASTSSITMPTPVDFDMEHSSAIIKQAALAVPPTPTTSNLAQGGSGLIARSKKIVAQAPPPGSIVLEKSCARCRIRKGELSSLQVSR